MHAEIDLFFTNPFIEPRPPGKFSRLYLLRRDVMICFGVNPRTGQNGQVQTLFLGVMGICTGIDLLGKFYAGNDVQGESGKRYEKFLNDFFNVSENEPKILYQFRNSMLHSFGNYHSARNGKVYRFRLKQFGTELIELDRNCYRIDIGIFFERFEQAIGKYEADLRTSADLQGKFLKMYPTYGTSDIGD